MKEAEPAYTAAVRAFWQARAAQTARQEESGRLDAGLRGAVTGGAHLDPVRDVIADLFIAEGMPPESIFRSVGLVLPGYYRPAKRWDLVVVHRDELVAAIELKSQVGPSFGNNVNNRSEEAIGSAADVRRAWQEGTFGAERPWLAYVFLLEEAPASIRPVADPVPGVYALDEVYRQTSYRDRYRILCDRLVKDGLYDAAWLVTSSAGPEHQISEPDPGLSFARLRAAIIGRVAYMRALLDT